MDPGAPDEPSREELVERVDQLEANQAEQREWWQDALPSRRGVLTAGAGLGLGALLSGSASGQSAAGQIGTPSSPEDAFLATVEAQSLSAVGLSFPQGHGVLGLPNHHINYESGLSNEEIARFTLAAQDKLEVWRLESSLKGGGTNSNVSLNVYDSTNTTQIATVEAGERKQAGDTPLGTSTAGATILVRLSTGSNPVDLTNTGVVSVVDG